MKVLHVIPSVSPKHGGPSFALPALVRASIAQGIEVTVATTNDDGPGGALTVKLEEPTLSGDGATYYYFAKTTEFYKVSFSLREWLRRNVQHFDIVHVHALFSYSSVVACRAAFRARVPYVIRPLGVLNVWSLQNRRAALKKLSLRWVELPLIRRAAAMHYTSEAEAREASAAHPTIAKARSAVVPLPVTIAQPGRVGCDDATWQTKYRASEERAVILFMSRIDPKKGIELLLSAFASTLKAFSMAVLVIAGAGIQEYLARLQDLAAELGCVESIIWAGPVAGDEKAWLLSAATVFVLPSYSENFGIAAAEALAAGLPSVLTEGVAVADDAKVAEAALVVAPRADEVARAILKLLKDAVLRSRLSANACKLVRDRYSPEAIGMALLKLYEDLTSPNEL